MDLRFRANTKANYDQFNFKLYLNLNGGTTSRENRTNKTTRNTRLSGQHNHETGINH